MRSSPITRPAAAQGDVKRSNSTRERTQTVNEAPAPGKPILIRRTSDRSVSEKVTGSTQTTFIRGSPLRVSKRVAPNSETQIPSQPRTTHSPSSTTAKTIRTAVISAARSKTAKTTSTSTPLASSKIPTASRLPGPKMPRSTSATAQPLWRWWTVEVPRLLILFGFFLPSWVQHIVKVFINCLLSFAVWSLSAQLQYSPFITCVFSSDCM